MTRPRMTVILFCRKCGVGYGAVNEIPTLCPNCLQETSWATSPIATSAAFPFKLSVNDRRFLRSLHIAADEEPEQI